MNSDRASSFLFSFQTLQTFMSSVLGACALYYPRRGTFARWCAASQTYLSTERGTVTGLYLGR